MVALRRYLNIFKFHCFIAFLYCFCCKTVKLNFIIDELTGRTTISRPASVYRIESHGYSLSIFLKMDTYSRVKNLEFVPTVKFPWISRPWEFISIHRYVDCHRLCRVKRRQGVYDQFLTLSLKLFMI